jgi:hypothetical protein
MTRRATEQSADGPVAVLHRAGGAIRAVIGTIPSAAAGSELGPPQPTVAAWREFRADRPEEISAWLDEHEAGSVIGVLPSAAVVCRTCTLPDAEPEHLDRALALQAEASMLTGARPHRRAMAVLPAAPGETSRSGIIVDWPEAPGDQDLPGADLAGGAKPRKNRPVTFAPDVAALGALLNGHRPGEPLVWFDRRDGSLALAVSHANGAILRAARVSPEPADSWAENMGRVVAETALSVGHTPAFTGTLVDSVARRIAGLDRNSGLIAPAETAESIRQRVSGTPQEARWWQDYGVAVGALVAASEQLAPLTRLQLAAPVESPSPVRRILDIASDPVAAFGITVLCLLVILVGPLVFSGLRLGLLKIKMPDLTQQLRKAREAEVQLAMYGELQKNAWPISKLLADIACNTPEEIDLDQIRIGDDLIRLSGRAKPDHESNLSAQEVIGLMQDNLRASKIFEEIRPSWSEPNSFGAYEFSLLAKVVNPYHRHEYPLELDYGKWTLAERLYGEPPADSSTMPIDYPPSEYADEEYGYGEAGDDIAASDEEQAAGERLNGRTPRFSGDTARPGRDGPQRWGSDRPLGGLPPSQDIPEPLTEQQVEAMDLGEAQEAWARISRALEQARVDSETKQRLWRDWRLVRERVRKLKKPPAGQKP